MSPYLTADLCDVHGDVVEVAAPIFTHFGGEPAFAGPVRTVECHEDNSLVREALSEDVDGAVLVVDGGGSRRCALVGDGIAQLALDHGWVGIIVYGCVRDRRAIDAMPIGIRALGTHPLRSVKRGEGRRDVSVRFADVGFTVGAWVYADEDGLIVAPGRLEVASDPTTSLGG